LAEHHQALEKEAQAPAWQVPVTQRGKAVMQKTAEAAAASRKTDKKRLADSTLPF